MGQKVNPIGIRLGIIKTWDSRWYADKDYSNFVIQDFKIRKYLKGRLKHAGISKIEIDRSAKRIRLRLFTARPGIVIGKKGSEIGLLKADLIKMLSSDSTDYPEVMIDIQEIKRPEVDAQMVAENVASQLERRVAFRRAMKRCVTSGMRFGAEGVKIICAGRLGGAEMARTEWYREGRVPLHTLRADIDYGFAEALTTYGIIGVKVFIYKGEIFNQD